MYRTIKRRFEPGNIKLVTVINTLGTTISLFIVLWIYYFLLDIHIDIKSNFAKGITHNFSQELFRGVSCHGPITTILSTLYLLISQNEKNRIYYLILSVGSLWLLFTTKSIWPSLCLGVCLGLMDLSHPSSPIQYPDL